MEAAENEFEGNLSSLISNLQNLNLDQQYLLLRSIISTTKGYVKWRIKSYLELEESPDLLTLLPSEIQLKILQNVDGHGLLAASQVSTAWNLMLNDHILLWKKTCKAIGVNIQKVPEHLSWKAAFITSYRQLSLLNKGKSFVGKNVDLQNSRNPIKIMDYQLGGYLCTVSDDDFVVIWNLPLNKPLVSFPVERCVSCMKFKGQHILVCGHSTGILTSWDVSNMIVTTNYVPKMSREALYDYDNFEEFSTLLGKFKMHSAVVFSCDFSEELQLMVSGGADGNIKFWCLKTCHMLYSFSNGQWVLKLILTPSDTSTKEHSILCLTTDNACKLSWPNEASQFDDSSVSETEKEISHLRGDVAKVKISYQKELNMGGEHIAPGIQKNSKYLCFIKQDFVENAANLILLEINSFEHFHSISINFKVRKLLALGDRFALLLTAGEKLFTSTLIVLDIITGDVVSSHFIPHSKMTTPDGAQITVCETEWLNGLTGWDSCPNSSQHLSSQPEKFYAKPLCHPYGTCILALGTNSNFLTLYTLWWVDGKDNVKSKVD